MKHIGKYLLALAFLLAGCTASFKVGEPSGDVSLQKASELLVGETVTIVTFEKTQHVEYEGTVQALTSNALVYQPIGSDSLVRIPMSSLRRISVPPSTGDY
ncbi:MAG: hypothetical protein KAJ12_04695, partial [Bacteroidetes bacterium]|nr:hypothetical protein [Bacteroidota bacterium]